MRNLALMRPMGNPVVYGPQRMDGGRSQLPLFNPEQLGRFQNIQGQAPWLYAEASNERIEEVPRPISLEQAEARLTQLEVLKRAEIEAEIKKESLERELVPLREVNAELREANLELRGTNHSLKKEIELLKVRLSLIESSGTGEQAAYATPGQLSTPDARNFANVVGNNQSNFPKNDGVLGEFEVSKNVKVQGENEAFETNEVIEENEAFESEKYKNLKRPGEGLRTMTGKGSSSQGGSQQQQQKSQESSGVPGSSNDMMNLMAKMMEGMTNLQQQILNKEKEDEPEMVKGQHDLPVLPEWTSTTGPIDLSDWLVLAEPTMADLSKTSSLWWSTLVEEAQEWYGCHLQLPPLERVAHEPVPSAKLSNAKWSRLERRASTMMLAAMPTSQREELIAAKKLSALKILCHVMTAYQPGGLGEKELILRQLESPPECSTLPEALQGLRRWFRWRHRAGDLGVQEPDAFLLLKGLNRITKKCLEQHRDLSFRISLARSTLQVDNTPTPKSVTSFALHLQAELEQVVHQDQPVKKQFGPGSEKAKAVRMKKLEQEDKGKGKGKDMENDDSEAPKCRFYLTPSGCKKGRDCRFSHDQKDDVRRCYICGSSEHLVPTCPRRKSESPPKNQQKTVRVDQGEDQPGGEGNVKDQTSTTSTAPEKEEEPTVKGLLEEATKVLKSIHSSGQPPSSTTRSSNSGGNGQREDMMANLQRQLDQLRASGPSMKVLRLSRIAVGSTSGLIDSGATHSLRPLHQGEDPTKLRPVEVTLADGLQKTLLMTDQGTMVAPSSDVEPIIPMGVLTSSLGCEVKWIEDRIEVKHPQRGVLKVTCKDGCPMISKSLALQLIEEAEKINKPMSLNSVNYDGELNWMSQLIETHPVLKSLPEHIRSSLLVPAGEWRDLPLNKRLRRKYQREGFVVHLFAGKDEEQTLRRTLDQCGGKGDNLLELDILRDSRHDFLKDKGTFSGLVRAAMDGCLDGILGGPNCRTRSILRHFPIEGQKECPRPVRSWKDQQEYGLHDLSEEEKKKVREDDIMLWRMIFLFMISTYARRAQGSPTVVRFLLEQPASPKERMPDCVSLWDQQEWKDIAEEFDLIHFHINQGDYGGLAKKPTTLANNLDLQHLPTMRSPKRLSGAQVSDSKMLSRWAPGVMKMVALALMNHIYNNKGSLRAMTWSQHLAHNHVPFRKDCRVCQEAQQRDHPHRRNPFPTCGVLSLDTSGPFHQAPDIVGKAKYMLVGTLTWCVPKSSPLEEPEDDQEDLPVDAPTLETGEEEIEDEIEKDLDQFIQGDGEREREVNPMVAPGNVEDATWDGHEGDPELSQKDQGQGDFEVRVFRMALPMSSKASPEVTKTIMEFLLRLRTDGYQITRVHTDRGREFSNQLRTWLTSRGIKCTRTTGDNPQSNGRAEVAVQSIKTMVRRVLVQAGEGSQLWPWALRYVNECLRLHRLNRSIDFPRFLQPVLVNKRSWKGKEFESAKEEVCYLAPAWSEHGHWVRTPSGEPQVTRYVLRNLQSPPEESHWIALERELLDTFAVRRRIRGKTSIKKVEKTKEEGEDEEIYEEMKIMKIVESEMFQMIHDDPELISLELPLISQLKKMASHPQEEEEEVLQTKVISPREVASHWEDWIQPSKEEVRSMLEEKEALKPISKRELEDLIRHANSNGKKVELIPSKLVFTRKPAPPPKGFKHKVRWVACGNYEEKKEGEENYSSGADAAAFRLLVHQATQAQWCGVSVDVKTAFLNAEMRQLEGEDLVMVKPPYLFVEKGILEEGVVYQPLRAVYGFRRSPRLWSQCRDETLMKLEIKVEVEGKEEILSLNPMESEPNLWVIKRKGDDGFGLGEKSYGLLMTYVDDTFVVGEEKVITEVVNEIQRIWTTSSPEWVTASPIKFLGMEVSKHWDGSTKSEVWKISQSSYTRDMLSREPELKVKVVPITKDQASQSMPEIKPTVELVKESQKEVGSLLWLVTRTRPDIMFAVSKMSALSTRDPKKALEIAKQIKGYIKGTVEDGLVFRKEEGPSGVLNAYSDASFAPEGDCSHGCSMVLLQGSLILWKSSRQPLVTLSTAEAELLEVVESLTMGESVAVVANEMGPEVAKISWCDSQAAVAILVSEGGSWRTRHLRIRSSFARSTIQQGNWAIHHVAGINMIADVGTKALSSQRLSFLKKLMGMTSEFQSEGGEALINKGQEEKNVSSTSKELMVQAVKVLTVAALLDVAQAESENNTKDEEDFEALETMMLFYTILVVFLCLLGRKVVMGLSIWIINQYRLWKTRRSISVLKMSPTTSGLSGKTSGKEEKTGVELHQRGAEGHKERRDKDHQESGGDQPAASSEASGSQRKVEESSRINDLTAPNPPMVPSAVGAQRQFKPLVTRWGAVYHTNRDCRYLKARSTGGYVELTCCPNCTNFLNRSQRPHPRKGDVIGKGEFNFHTNGGCEQMNHALKLQQCSYCKSKED